MPDRLLHLGDALHRSTLSKNAGPCSFPIPNAYTQMQNPGLHPAQDSGLNLPRFCFMAWTFLLSSSNFLISSACSAFFLSRSWKR